MGMKVSRRLAMLALCSSLIGCVPKDRGASAAYERRDYHRSAEIYQQLHLEKPDDAGLRASRDRARTKHYELQVTAMTRVENNPKLFIPLMRGLLAQRDLWTPGQKSLGSPPLDARLAALQSTLSQSIKGDLQQEMAASRLLTASGRIESYQVALPSEDFDELWAELRDQLRLAGERHCLRHMPAQPETSPFLASLLASYCTMLRAPIPSAIDLGLAGSLQMKISVDGASDAQISTAQNALAMSFVESAWYDPTSHHQLSGTISGTSTLSFTAREVQLFAPWSRLEAYRASETYQESYTEYERYTERVTRTVYRSESYSCGTYQSPRTCTRSVPSTQYDTQYRTRPVTKYRTATRLVTRYRNVLQHHKYAATLKSGRYSARWQIDIDLRPLPGGSQLSFPVSAAIAQHGHDHDITFAAAKLAPSRANLMTAPQWFDYVAARLADKIHEELERHWQTSFCRLPSYTAETAARCVHGAASPTAARLALTRIFGGDTDLVLERMTRGGRFSKKPAARLFAPDHPVRRAIVWGRHRNTDIWDSAD